MRPNIAVVILAAALIVAAGITVNGGLYQVVSNGPENAYLVHRWTGQTWHLTGAVSHLVRVAPPALEREYLK